MSKLKNGYPSDEELEKTKRNFDFFKFKNGELTQLNLKSDVLLLAYVFEDFIKGSINEFDINPLDCVSLPGFTWQNGLKDTGKELQTVQHRDLFLALERNIRGGIRSARKDRNVKTDQIKKLDI